MLDFHVLKFAVGIVIVFSSAVFVHVKFQNGTIQSLYYLGTIKGKAFFVDRPQTTRNWTVAREFCAQGNLRLASITSIEQETFLINALSAIPDIGHVNWIAGRTSRTLSQFVWDYEPNSIPSTNRGFYYSNALPEHFACLAFSHKPYEMRAFPCYNNWGTLCEAF